MTYMSYGLTLKGLCHKGRSNDLYVNTAYYHIKWKGLGPAKWVFQSIFWEKECHIVA